MSISSFIDKLNEQGRPTKQVDPALSILPSGAFAHDVAHALRVERELAEEARRQAEEAARRAEAEAEAEYRDSLYAKTERWREGDAPDDLGADVAGLPPARNALVRFATWRQQTKAELVKLEAARQNYLRLIGVPALHQAEFDALIAKDKSGLLAWMRGGANGKSKPDLHAFERSQIEAKLAGSGHEAEIARAALISVEDEIAVLHEAVRVLDERHQRFAQAALVEAAAPLIAEYRAAGDRLAGLAAELAGLLRAAPNADLHRGPIRQVPGAPLRRQPVTDHGGRDRHRSGCRALAGSNQGTDRRSTLCRPGAGSMKLLLRSRCLPNGGTQLVDSNDLTQEQWRAIAANWEHSDPALASQFMTIAASAPLRKDVTNAHN